MVSFLERHFNRTLEESEREAILKDFPKPHCKAIVAPRLDEQVKEQLKRKGRDPSYGAEKSLFKIQEQLLDITGPLACLWADLLNREARITPEDTLLLIQRACTSLVRERVSLHHPRAEEDCVVPHQSETEVTGLRRV